MGSSSQPPAALSAEDKARRAAVDKLRADFEERVRTLAYALAVGRITLVLWLAAMQDEIRRYHLACAAIGANGVIDEAIVRLVEQRSTEQIHYLNQWASALSTATITAALFALIRSRALLYAGAGLATFYRAVTTVAGMPALPAYPGDGSTECLTNCQCWWIINRLGSGDWDCFWWIQSAEHCPQCAARSFEWYPLKIRGGVIQPYNRAGLFA